MAPKLLLPLACFLLGTHALNVASPGRRVLIGWTGPSPLALGKSCSTASIVGPSLCSEACTMMRKSEMAAATAVCPYTQACSPRRISFPGAEATADTSNIGARHMGPAGQQENHQQTWR